MSRVISFRDLQRIPALSTFTEFELLSPKLDALVNSYLVQLGFDIDKPVLYVPVKHRDMAGHVAVGYRAVGEINDDETYLNSSVCPPIERLIWISRKDMGLARYLAQGMGAGGVNLSDNSLDESPTDWEDYQELDEDDIKTAIQFLTWTRENVRGTPYNASGALKTPQEYQE